MRKRKERMRKDHPQEDGAPVPSLHHPSNGVVVPARRYHRSGETVSPFRRDGIAVPARRHHRSGETVSPFRRDRAPRPRAGRNCQIRKHRQLRVRGGSIFAAENSPFSCYARPLEVVLSQHPGRGTRPWKPFVKPLPRQVKERQSARPDAETKVFYTRDQGH